MFLWSIPAHLHPRNNSHLQRVPNYRECFGEINIRGFDFSNGFRCKEFHKFEKLNDLPINVIELNFYQDQNKWKHKIIPIEISENN